MYPSMGRPETGSGSRFGGSLFGNFKFEYFSGNLKKQISLGIFECFCENPEKCNTTKKELEVVRRKKLLISTLLFTTRNLEKFLALAI